MVYEAVLLDCHGHDIARSFEETKAKAIKKAKYFLSARWARESGTTHARLETKKAEVRDFKTEECLWDQFL